MIALNVLATDCIECSGKYLPRTLVQTNALNSLADHFIIASSMFNKIAHIKGLLWQVYVMHTIEDECPAQSCISLHWTHIFIHSG